MIPTEKKDELLPVCPHCRKELAEVWFRELKTDIIGSRRCIYFCPECRACLGVSHRKGFFLGL